MGFVIGLVHGEGDTFGISFPDFPGCVAGGSTLDETVSRGEDALAVHVESMLEDGESLPVPRSRSAIVNDPEFSEDVKDATFVALPLPNARRVRVHVMIDESLLSAVERAATSEGYTRSGYFERAIRDRLVRQSESPILSPLSERSASAEGALANAAHLAGAHSAGHSDEWQTIVQRLLRNEPPAGRAAERLPAMTGPIHYEEWSNLDRDSSLMSDAAARGPTWSCPAIFVVQGVTGNAQRWFGGPARQSPADKKVRVTAKHVPK